jgi:hypothetical protein
MKKETYWAVYDPKGQLVLLTLRPTRRSAIAATCLCADVPFNWEQARREGWTVEKVWVVKAAKTPEAKKV